MTCGFCGFNFPLTQTVAGLTICPRCWRSLKTPSGEPARAEDTTALSDDELTALRKLRSEARRRPA